MANSKQIVYLSQVQYTELIANGSITVDGVTVNYDENDIYVTPQTEPITNIKINDINIGNNGIANIPIASPKQLGVIKIKNSYDETAGLTVDSQGIITIQAPFDNSIKAATISSRPITPSTQHKSVFYGLAKASGDTTQSQSSNTIGQYTPEAKGAIQKMLGVSDLIATEENNLIASKAYAIGDVFTANGKLYKATAAIAVDGAIITDGANANCEETSVGEGFVKKTDYASTSTAGISIADSAVGIGILSDHRLYINAATSDLIKGGSVGNYRPITPTHQHESAFYGLAKAAGADEKDSTLPVGQYTDTAKSAIRTMLGAVGNEDYATVSKGGVIKVNEHGLTIDNSGILSINPATTSYIKNANASFMPIVPSNQHMSTFYGLAKAAGDTTQSASDNAVGTYTDEAKSAIRTMIGSVGDVQVNDVSVVANGVASIPMADVDTFGAVKVMSSNGIGLDANKRLYIVYANTATVKGGTNAIRPIVPFNQHESTFYGLAKAAGDTTQSASSNAVGTYTDEAKLAIQTMLGIDLSSIAAEVEIPLVETVTGTDVTINGQPNVRYNCGEVSTITINPPAAGSIDVIFTSGTSVAVLTLPSTVKMPEWFDATALETDTIYEILITDGVYGSVMTWPV